MLISLCGLTAKAQEEGQSGTEVQELSHHPDLNLNEDKTPAMDVDSKANKVQAYGREGNAQPINPKGKGDSQIKPSANEKEEDPLSFNFLYFIIQKFKISDIVDD